MRKSIFTTLDYYPEQKGSVAEAYQTAYRLAKTAENSGCDCIWLGEHHFENLGSIPNPAVLLSALAKITNNIRLGSAISVLPLRDVNFIAEDYAMVDIISGGRLNMGVGTGAKESEYKSMQVDFATRQQEFDSRLLKLKDLWNPTNQEETCLNVKPIQTGSPPIYIATSTPERAYLAGKNGYSVLTIVSPAVENLSQLEKVLQAHKKGSTESNTPGTEVVVTVFAHVAETEQKALSCAEVSVGRFLEAMSGSAVPNPAQICQSMIGKNTALFGSREQVATQLQLFREIGVEHISFLSNFGGMTSEQSCNSIQHLCSIVDQSNHPINAYSTT